MEKHLKAIKIGFAAIVLCAIGIAGYLFHDQRVYKEPVVASPQAVVKKLSDYSDVVKGTVNDCNIYIFDSGVPGGTMMIMGSNHPEEPTGVMTCNMFVENLNVTQGKIIIVTRVNTSGSLTTRNGEAYPRYFTQKTEWGQKKWRMGDRCASPLDSWPDPEVYIHYPSRLSLAYMDIRNTNRNWPGKKDGLLTERTCYALMQVIEQEGVDMTLDLHEAELEYPVENMIVVHEKASDVGAMVSMMLTSQTFDVPLSMDFSPKALHGLTHREIGDFSNAASYLAEVAEPMLDRIRGITDEELLMSGKDRFVMKAGEHGLLYSPIDESGWPIEKRVARHVETARKIMEVNNTVHPDQTITFEGIPSYEEILTNGCGPYYHDPATASADRLFYD